MASKKDLKKDIDLLMSLVLNDCFYVLEYNTKVRAEMEKLGGKVYKRYRVYQKDL